MTRRRWWGAPLALERPAALRRLDQLFTDTEPTFGMAQPLTVRVRGFMLREDEDWHVRGDNDIAVVSTFQFGAEPPVQRLHYLQDGVSRGWHGAFFHDTVLSVRDLDAGILSLRVQIYDVDGISGTVVEQVVDAASSVAVAFPQLARYAGGLAALAPSLLKLVDQLDQHDAIIDQRLKLELEAPGTGHPLLQPGYYVCFRNEVEEGLYLEPELRVTTDEGGTEHLACSYVVLEVARCFHEHYEWEIDQKVAKLVAELNGKGKSGKAAIEFLRDTISGYSKFRRLERAHALLARRDRTDSEERLLAELRSDKSLAPFLPGDHRD